MLGAEKGKDQFIQHLVWGSFEFWDCISQTGLSKAWRRMKHANLLKPKLMSMKGWPFPKRFNRFLI